MSIVVFTELGSGKQHYRQPAFPYNRLHARCRGVRMVNRVRVVNLSLSPGPGTSQLSSLIQLQGEQSQRSPPDGFHMPVDKDRIRPPLVLG